MATHVLQNTALTGLAECGVMECGVYGLYESQEEILDENQIVEYYPFKIQIGTSTFSGAKEITWSHSLGSDNVSQCTFSLYNFRPELYDKVLLFFAGRLFWRGFVSSYSTSYSGGNVIEGNFTIEFSITAVSLENWLTREYVNEVFDEKSAGFIISSLLKEYTPNIIKKGTIVSGKQYDDIVRFENEQLSSAISRLADVSDCYYYIDPYGRFHFKEKYTEQSPINVDYEVLKEWNLHGKTKYPTNNYHNTSTSMDSSNIFTEVRIKGVRYRERRAYFKNIDYYLKLKKSSSSILESCYLLTAEQKEIYTPSNIFDVNRIFCVFAQCTPNLVDPLEGFIIKTVEKYYDHPKGMWYSSSGISKRYTSGYLGTTLQYEYIIGRSSSWVYNLEEGIYKKLELTDIDKDRMTYWNNYCPDSTTWTPSTCLQKLTWETLEQYSGKEKFSSVMVLVEQLALTPAFTWQISYGGNSISFVAPCTFNNQNEYDYYLQEGYVDYVESEPYTYQVMSSKASVYGSREGSGYANIVHTVEDSSICNSTQANTYGNALLQYNENGTSEVSYSMYMREFELFQKYVRPGMFQDVTLHGKSFKLGVENVSYNIISFSPFVVKVDITLATKTKNLEEILARLLKY